MNQSHSHRVRVSLSKEANIVWMSDDNSKLLVSEKPSKLKLYEEFEFDEDPFNLNNESEEPKDTKCKYKVSKEVDLEIGTLLLMEQHSLNGQSVFIFVSNDRAIVILDQNLTELFRNEELIKDDDLCFFTAVCTRKTKQGNLQSNHYNN